MPNSNNNSNFKKKLSINIFANCPVSENSIGGGDRIMIENVRAWQKLKQKISFFGCIEAIEMAKKNNLNLNFQTISKYDTKKLGIHLTYLLRIIKSIFLKPKLENNSILYSASDFLPDIVCPFLIKKKQNLHWVIGLYLIYENPFRQKKMKFKKVIPFLMQQISFYLIKKRADRIWVLCEEDKERLISKKFNKNLINVVSAGCDKNYIDKLPEQSKKYDACFVGRFHHQKGIPDLFIIWKNVISKMPNAKLVIIGWGNKSWINLIRNEIKRLNLSKNIFLMGFLDGEKKYQVLKQSKIFVFPSHYESFGIAALEAMAAGLPVVSYNLSIFKNTYGQALLQVPLNNTDDFAKAVIKLLENKILYEETKNKSQKISNNFNWQTIARNNLQSLQYFFN